MALTRNTRDIDPETLDRARMQIEAHPRFQLIASQFQGRGGAGALDPRDFGVDYLPQGYVYSPANGQIIDATSDWGDKILKAAGGTMLGLGVAGAAGVGPLASSAAPGVVAPSAAAPLLPNLATPAMTTAGMTAPAGLGAASAATPAAGSVFSRLATGQNLQRAGAAASAASQAMASNRGARTDIAFQGEQLRQGGENNYLNQLLNREQEKRVAAGDAWRRMLQTDYVANYKPAGLNLSPYSRPIATPSSGMQTAAGDPQMMSELQSRAGYRYDPFGGADVEGVRIDPQFGSRVDALGKSSTWEKILGIAGPALSLRR